MFNVRLAGDHLYGKWLFTWLSLLISLMVPYFVLSICTANEKFVDPTAISRQMREVSDF